MAYTIVWKESPSKDEINNLRELEIFVFMLPHVIRTRSMWMFSIFRSRFSSPIRSGLIVAFLPHWPKNSAIISQFFDLTIKLLFAFAYASLANTWRVNLFIAATPGSMSLTFWRFSSHLYFLCSLHLSYLYESWRSRHSPRVISQPLTLLLSLFLSFLPQ